MAKDELKRLPPEERIKRLKELEQQRRREIEEAQKQIKESEEEIKEGRKWKEKVPIPEVAKEDLEGLSEEGKQLLKVHKGAKEIQQAAEEEPVRGRQRGKSLEEAVSQEKILLPGAQNVDYAVKMQFAEAYKPFQEMSMQELQQQVYRASKTAEERGYATRDEAKTAYYAQSEVEKRLEAAEAGTYSLTETAARAAMLTRELSSHLQQMYKGRAERSHQEYRL